MKVAIVGSRNFEDATIRVRKCLVKMKGLYGRDLVVITGASGAVDWAAINEAVTLGITFIGFPANWAKYGRKAGILRNKKVVKNADMIFAFWDGKSRGTMDVIRRGQVANKKVIIRREEEK